MAGAGATAVAGGGNGTTTGDAAVGTTLVIVGAVCGGVVFLALVVLVWYLEERRVWRSQPSGRGGGGMEMSRLQGRPKSTLKMSGQSAL